MYHFYYFGAVKYPFLLLNIAKLAKFNFVVAYFLFKVLEIVQIVQIVVPFVPFVPYERSVLLNIAKLAKFIFVVAYFLFLFLLRVWYRGSLSRNRF